MPTYQYQAYEKSGKILKGVVNAESPDRAQSQLREKGFYLTRLRESRAGKIKGNPRRHRLLFLKQLASFLKGGQPLDQALQSLLQTLPDGRMKLAVADLKERIRRGESLCDGMKAHPEIFSPFVAAMTRTGEKSGNLAGTLRELAEHEEREQALRAQLRNALAYPLFVAFFCFGVVIFLFTFVIPMLAKTVKELGGTLPLLTRALFFVSDLLRQWGLWMAAALAAGLLFLRRAVGTPAGKLWLDSKWVRLPWVGDIIRMRESGRFCSAMATLIGGGMDLVRALETTEAIFKNEPFRVFIRSAREQVVRGESLSSVLQRSDLFPFLVPSFARAGETSGDLKNQLAYVGNMLEEEAQSRLKQLATFLEPALIVTVGILVGVAVLAVVLPIVQLSEIAQ